MAHKKIMYSEPWENLFFFFKFAIKIFFCSNAAANGCKLFCVKLLEKYNLKLLMEPFEY